MLDDLLVPISNATRSVFQTLNRLWCSTMMATTVIYTGLCMLRTFFFLKNTKHADIPFVISKFRRTSKQCFLIFLNLSNAETFHRIKIFTRRSVWDTQRVSTRHGRNRSLVTSHLATINHNDHAWSTRYKQILLVYVANDNFTWHGNDDRHRKATKTWHHSRARISSMS